MRISQILIAASLLIVGLPSAFGSETLCPQTERTIFSCKVAGDKLLSVCRSSVLSLNSGHIQYRFGTQSNVEMVHPPTPENPMNLFYYHGSAYSGGYMEHLSFRVGEHSYVVYDHYSSAKSPTEKHSKDAGILVIDASQNEKYFKCLSPNKVRFENGNLLGNHLQDDDFFPYK